MIGIYKITNKINNKIYIGQSSNIARRWSYYRNPPKNIPYNSAILKAIDKYGIDNFQFEIIEQCSTELLNEKEIYWIAYFNSYKDGYNLTPGGDYNVGESNPNSSLTVDDIKQIRTIYASKTKLHKIAIYEELFKNKCGLRAFEKVWNGETWTHIMMEVYTEENKNYYNTIAKIHNGQDNFNSVFTDEEVMIIRNRYVNETTRQILEDYKDRVSYSGLEKILLGVTYSYLPIYKKKLQTWINK